MDVQCERCKAEYEFDDALVSGRGTTVKCTGCGHQFKIRRASDRPDATPDRWLVRTTEGRELVFMSLRELQKAILAKQVGRADALVRGNDPSRALGAISELESFFEEAASGSSSGSRPPPVEHASKRTVVGHAAAQTPMPKMVSSRPPPPMAARPAPALRPIPTPTPPPMTSPPSEKMRPRVNTIRPPASAPAVPPPSARPGSGASAAPKKGDHPEPISSGAAVSVAPVLSAGNLVGVPAPMALPLASMTGTTEHTPPMPVHTSDPPPLPARASRGAIRQAPPTRTAIHSPPQASGRPQMSSRPPPPTIQPYIEASSPLPPPTVPVRVERPSYRDSLGSNEDSSELVMPGAPRRVGGWLVALVLLVGAGVIGMAVAKPYLAAQTAQASASAVAIDPRAQALLVEGERAMAAGDLDSANDDFVKASALAEKEPRVLVDLARLATVRADVPWLRMKILPTDASDDRKAIQAQLDDLATRAKKAAAQALAAAPELQTAALAQIDALRVAGDSSGARALVSRVTQNASEPETAYVLAALDLAETEPLWPMILERLRIAAAAEGDSGRARAALVYALARSGDDAGAKTELEKLSGLSRPNPLVGALRAFIGRGHDAKDAGARGIAGMAAATATVDVSALPPSARAPSQRAGGGGGGGGGNLGGGNPNDPRVLLQQAETAKQARDWDRARALYSSALAQNASDSEALAGLGDCDHALHDLPAAAAYYHRALAANPVYLPALVGLADVEWETGDKDEAQKTYHDITDRFPEGTYPGRVKLRANDSSGGAIPHAATPAATESPAPAGSVSSDPTGSP